MSLLVIAVEGGDSAWQVWPVPETIPAGGVRETGTYIFELRDCPNALDADLYVDDIPLEALRSRKSDIARWRWQPGFHAGEIEVALRLPGMGLQRFGVTTDPDLRKLTRDDFDAMLREVLEDTHALFSLSAFRKGIARQPGNRLPPLARLEFLRSRVEEIAKTISAIGRSPRHCLTAVDMTLPAHRAARATGPEIIKSFRGGEIRIETVRPSRLPATLGGRLPAQITLRKRQNSVDVPEHRQIKACLKSWGAWLLQTSDLLAKLDLKGPGDVMTTAGNWSLRTRRLARQLNAAANSGFMNDVGEAPPVLRMSSLFRNDPIYLRFYRLWQDMNLGLAALFGDFLKMPIAKTYELYELWCFLRLLRAAVEEYGSASVDLGNLFASDSAGGVTIAAGAVVVPIHGDKILCFQRQYREYWTDAEREGSFSRTMIPDLVLSGSGLGSPERRVIILDAKYRINEGLNDALSSIHAYRDALVREVATGEIDGIVTAAYLLTPHVPTLNTDFQKTAVPGRLFHPQYREKFCFGAVTLRPGMSTSELQASLRAIINDASAIAP